MDLDQLQRSPDVDGPGLQASDAADRLILDEAAALVAGSPAGSVAVIDDAYGALALGCGAPEVRVHQDLVTGERALAANARRLGIAGVRAMGFGPDVVTGARVVLMRLPRSLDRLAEVAALIAAYADPEVVVVAGGRIKHMTPQMNAVLREVFVEVDVSHARQKSRVLIARAPRPADAQAQVATWPRTEKHQGLVVAAHGGVFAGPRIDIGTRLLLEVLDDAVPNATTAVDLACGSGIVAAALARARPSVTVTATDRSAAAAASAQATATLNGVADRVTAQQADGMERLPDRSQELIALNPPFHSDAALSTGIAHHLFADASRTLSPGGELWAVWNSHLRYRGTLERMVGPTRQIIRNAKFTVTASVKH